MRFCSIYSLEILAEFFRPIARILKIKMFGYLKNFKFLYAVTILIGMIVGAGTFGIPYVFSQAGFAIGFFYLLLLGRR